jgi:hypothetical protein
MLYHRQQRLVFHQGLTSPITRSYFFLSQKSKQKRQAKNLLLPRYPTHPCIFGNPRFLFAMFVSCVSQRIWDGIWVLRNPNYDI